MVTRSGLIAPWLQPGDLVRQMIAEPFPTVSPLRLPTKTVRNGSLSIPVCYHRAKAAVLMKSLRATCAGLVGESFPERVVDCFRNHVRRELFLDTHSGVARDRFP